MMSGDCFIYPLYSFLFPTFCICSCCISLLESAEVALQCVFGQAQSYHNSYSPCYWVANPNKFGLTHSMCAQLSSLWFLLNLVECSACWWCWLAELFQIPTCSESICSMEVFVSRLLGSHLALGAVPLGMACAGLPCTALGECRCTGEFGNCPCTGNKCIVVEDDGRKGAAAINVLNPLEVLLAAGDSMWGSSLKFRFWSVRSKD